MSNIDFKDEEMTPVEYNSIFCSDKLLKSANNVNTSMKTFYENDEDVITIEKIMGTDGKDYNECIIRAKDILYFGMLLDEFLECYADDPNFLIV